MNAPIAKAIRIWRDIRVLRVLAQAVFVLLVILLGNWLYTNLQTNLRTTNISFSYDFLQQPASMGISEGLPLQPTDSYSYALMAGAVNTLRVVGLGILLATLLGLIIGIARLSSNWLVRTLATVYIEALRNTPLVVQLVFWYTAVLLKLPRVDESLQFFGAIYLSQRGLAMPQPQPTETFALWGYVGLAGLVLGVGVYLGRRIYLERVQRPGTPWLWGLSTLLFIACLGWLLMPQAPLSWELPVRGLFNFEGGLQLTPEFTALLLGLVVYTASFIAEIVRAGILAVSKGQKEAARAMGLTNLQILRLVVLPQALRVIIPPLTSQYLNLAKNSSLAVAIGYPDLFNIANTILNQTGRAIEVILIIMGSYLSISLFTSLFMNWYNRRARLVER